MTYTFDRHHIESVERVNESLTPEEHRVRQAYLDGLRYAYESLTGQSYGQLIIKADMHYIDQGIERPMCGGVFLDWKPKEPQ